MPDTNDIADEVAFESLKADARNSSIKYSALGINAFLPEKRSNPKLKPNTRFLRNIIKDADNHNASLAKLDKASSTVFRNESKPWSDVENHRSTSRVKRDNRSDSKGQQRTKCHYAKRDQDSRASLEDNLSLRHSRGDHRRHDYKREHEKSDHAARRRSRSPRRHHHHRRHRIRSHSSDTEIASSTKKSRRSRSSSSADCHRQHRRRSPNSSHRKPRRYRRQEDTEDESADDASLRARTKSKTGSKRSAPAEDDSDPLERIINQRRAPQEPVTRGRGATRSGAAMDEHFKSNYDPTTDTQPEIDGDDWDQALEALRDRQRWKQMGATRLREAGFSDRDIDKWKKGGEQQEDDIKWKSFGQGREWDRGKVMTTGGFVETPPDWAKK